MLRWITPAVRRQALPEFPPFTSSFVKLLLIDGHYYVYRSYFAIRDLSNSRGEPTNAIYGFIKTVRRMVKDFAPDLGAVVWDGGLPKRRMELQPAYKQQRAEMPEPMKPQLDFIQRIVPLLGLASLSLDETEADDLMATYTCHARTRGDSVVLATNDKDLFQLVDDLVKVYSTNKADLASPKDAFALLGAEAVLKSGASRPIRSVRSSVSSAIRSITSQAWTGSDQKVRRRCWRRTARSTNCSPILDAVKNERIRDKLKTARAQIEQNREMVRLDLDLPVPQPLDALGIRPRPAELALELEKCEFKSLLAEVRAEAAAALPPPKTEIIASSPARTQGELF